MIDLSRYRGLLVVGVGLFCAFVLCNVALVAAFGVEPAMFSDPDRQLAWSQLERMGSRVSGVELKMRRRGIDDQEPFGVVLGQSTTLRGIDPVILNQQCEPKQPWLLINGFGSSFIKLHYYAQALIASELKPDTIVLGLHATMIAGQDRDRALRDTASTAAMPSTSKKQASAETKPVSTDAYSVFDVIQGALKGSNRWIRKRIWTRTQRKNISHHMNMTLFEARLAFHRQLDNGAVGLFPPTARPWAAPGRDELPKRRPDAFLKRQIKGWREFGWYDSASYTTTNRHADAFRELIAGCDALGPNKIVIILLPVTSDLRGWLPPEALSAMHELIDEVSVGRPVRVIDLRDAMPDDAFADYAHLNPAGRAAFSSLLAERLSAEDNED